MDNPAIIAIVSAIIGAGIGGLISYIAARQQLQIMRAQLKVALEDRERQEITIKQDRILQQRTVEAQQRWEALQPAMEVASRVLIASRLREPQDPDELADLLQQWAFKGRELRLILPRELASTVNDIMDTYMTALANFVQAYAHSSNLGRFVRYPREPEPIEELEALRQRTVDLLNAITQAAISVAEHVTN